MGAAIENAVVVAALVQEQIPQCRLEIETGTESLVDEILPLDPSSQVLPHYRKRLNSKIRIIIHRPQLPSPL